MISLTGKQKSHLRSLGQQLSADVAIGKSGVTFALSSHLQRLLDERELIKVRLAEENTGRDRKHTADKLAAEVQALCVGVVGRTCLLYRPNKSLPADDRVRLE
jgi:RNA-binding protein